MLGLIRAWFLWPKTEDIQIKWDTYAQCITWTTLLTNQPMRRRLRGTLLEKVCFDCCLPKLDSQNRVAHSLPCLRSRPPGIKKHHLCQGCCGRSSQFMGFLFLCILTKN